MELDKEVECVPGSRESYWRCEGMGYLHLSVFVGPEVERSSEPGPDGPQMPGYKFGICIMGASPGALSGL